MTVITTLITLPPDLVERDRVRRQAQRVGALEHPGLAPLRDVAFTAEGLTLSWDVPVVDDVAPQSSGQVIVALASVAAGLAVLHDAGLAHGGIDASSIHVSGGRGLLTGWRPGGTSAGDVCDLVTVLESWLPPASVGADIAQLIISAQDPDVTARPSMARVAAALDRASTYAASLVSPPAHRRGSYATLASDTPSDDVGGAVVDVAPMPRMSPASVRGRHAAPRPSLSPAMAQVIPARLTWRWGAAAAGAAAAVFLGVSALTSPGSAQEMCPATVSAPVATGSAHAGG